MTLEKQLQEIIDRTIKDFSDFESAKKRGHTEYAHNYVKDYEEKLWLAKALKEAVLCLKHSVEYCIFKQCSATCSNRINEIEKIMRGGK